MQSNLTRAMDVLFANEGGYVDHPKDPGGATNMGVTRKKLAEWRGITPYTDLPKSEVQALTKVEATKIYEKDFWKKLRCDALPMGIDLTALDYGVNSGPTQSAKDLQRALGKIYTGEIDGIVGAKTITAANNSNLVTVIKAHCARRLGMYKSLAIWNTFGKGWSKRISYTEATALSWVASADQLIEEAKNAKDKSSVQAETGAVVVTAGAGDSILNISSLPIWLVLVVCGVLFFLLVVRAAINKDRAAALAKAVADKQAKEAEA